MCNALKSLIRSILSFAVFFVGVCAMDKKARSKPMREILSRLPEDLFEVIIFGDKAILEDDIETWPIVECLIAFYSTKFPTEKALKYVALRSPMMLNDLEMEAILKDRRKVYRLLQENGIDVSKHVFLDRDNPTVQNVVEEYDEYIVVNGVQINKPLVEKPVDAEDHGVYIYYPMSGEDLHIFINDIAYYS
jgi:inositol hexakisphosphate/diphosphoinositol-pentakisphosphate kinase